MPGSPDPMEGRSEWRVRLYHINFGADTPAGKAFDVELIAAIVLSVLVVSQDTVDSCL